MGPDGAADGSSGAVSQDSSGTRGSGSIAEDTTSATVEPSTTTGESTGSSGTTAVDPCEPGQGWVWSHRFEDEESIGVFNDVLALGSDIVAIGTGMDESTDRPTWVRRYDSAGNEIWRTELAGPGLLSRGVIVDDEDIVVCTWDDEQGQFVRLSGEDGAVMWSQEQGQFWCWGLATDASGVTAVVGTEFFDDQPNIDQVRAIDGAGNPLWTWESTPNPGTELDGVTMVDGETIVVGDLYDEFGADRVRLARLDAQGELLWSTTYEGVMFPSELRATEIAIEPGGDIVLAGRQRLGVTGGTDVVVWRSTSEGELVWMTVHDFGHPDDRIGNLVISPRGDIIVTGAIGDQNPARGDIIGAFDVLLASFASADGSLQWSDTLELSEIDSGRGLVLDQCGGLIVGGGSFEAKEYASRPWLGRYMP